MLIYVLTSRNVRISVLDIEELEVWPERCTGDHSEFDDQNTWTLIAKANDGLHHILYESPGFDQEGWFRSSDAKKGENYQAVMAAKKLVEDKIEEMRQITEIIDLGGVKDDNL